MASVLPGFEYDIFISYRQKDNKGDAWVSGFVDALKTELEATFKEDVSIYFDINPHDGLHENYDVDDSLKEKLKCLILIPIVSRTYCDVRSFAWEKEFKVFIVQAAQDGYGLKVKLNNGNTASRVLPVRIHELDAEDVKLFEAETGSVLRPIDFIFKSTGVNRPLLPSDKKEDSTNHSLYRDQVNKVANAIQEIVAAMKKPIDVSKPKEIPARNLENPKPVLRKWAAIVAFVLLATSGIAYFLFQKTEQLKDPAQSGLAILPFTNNTGSTDLDFYGVGMASEIRTKISLNKSFNFLSSLQATLRYANTQKSPKEIGDELDVDFILSGVYQKAGDKIKVEAELIDAANGKLIWALPIETELEDFFQVQSKIAEEVLRRFSASGNLVGSKTTTSLEAYSKYTQGVEMYTRLQADSAEQSAIRLFEAAVAIDSGYIDAWSGLIDAEGFLFLNNPSQIDRKLRVEKYLAYFEKQFSTAWQKNLAYGSYYYRITHQYDLAIKAFNKALEVDPQNLYAIAIMSYIYKRKLDFKNAIQFKKKALLIDPGSAGNWKDLGDVFSLMGDYKNEMKARLKSCELSNAKEPAILTLWAAIKVGYLLDQLPKHVKDQAGEDFTYWNYASSGRITDLVKASRTNKNYFWLVTAYHLRKQDDSVRYWANEGLRKGEVEFAGYFHAAAGNREKALSVSDSFYNPLVDTGDDRMILSSKFMDRIAIYTMLLDYQKATDLLKQLNEEIPDFGNYAFFSLPPFNRIRKEYPPFQEALNNVKQQPMVNVEEIIKF